MKKDLSMCLRKEVRIRIIIHLLSYTTQYWQSTREPKLTIPQRIDRTTRNREEAKLRTAKKKEVWSAIDRERELDMGYSVPTTTATTTAADPTEGSR